MFSRCPWTQDLQASQQHDEAERPVRTLQINLGIQHNEYLALLEQFPLLS